MAAEVCVCVCVCVFARVHMFPQILKSEYATGNTWNIFITFCIDKYAYRPIKKFLTIGSGPTIL